MRSGPGRGCGPLLASVGLRLLNGGEEWVSQCLVGPSERGASMHVELLDTRLSWELGMSSIP